MSDIIAFNGYSDGDVDTNFTNLRTLNEIADERFSRRQTIVGGLKASATAFLGTSVLAACSGDEVIGPATALVNAGQDATTTAGKMSPSHRPCRIRAPSPSPRSPARRSR